MNGLSFTKGSVELCITTQMYIGQDALKINSSHVLSKERSTYVWIPGPILCNINLVFLSTP